jgi:hypothetical protein
MKFKEAVAIMDETQEAGFMVSFEWAEKGMLRGDHFPDKHAGEELIKTGVLAWELAHQFAKNTYGKCVNIYVTKADFSPVDGYRKKMIVNRDIPKDT